MRQYPYVEEDNPREVEPMPVESLSIADRMKMVLPHQKHDALDRNASGTPMTLKDMQELLRAERLWWSKTQEIQQNRLEKTVDDYSAQASEKLVSLGRQLEEKLMRRLNEEKAEQQRINENLSRQSMIGTEAPGALKVLKDTLSQTVDFMHKELDIQKRGQRALAEAMDAQREELVLQMQGIDAAVNDLRRFCTEQLGYESKLKEMEKTLAALHSEHRELRAGRDEEMRGSMIIDASIANLQAEIKRMQDQQGELVQKNIEELELQKHRHTEQIRAIQEQHRSTGALNSSTLEQRIDDVDLRLREVVEKVTKGVREQFASDFDGKFKSMAREVQDRCLELSRALDEERCKRINDIAEMKANVEVSLEKTVKAIDMPSKGLQSTLEQERKDQSTELSRMRELHAKLEERLEQLTSEVAFSHEEARRRANEARTQCDALSNRMEAEIDVIRRQSDKRPREIDESSPRIGLGDNSPADAQAIEAALARERHNLIARGDSPSQLRAEVVDRMDTLLATVRAEMKDRFSSFDANVRDQFQSHSETLGAELRCDVAAMLGEYREMRGTSSDVGTAIITTRVEVLEMEVKDISDKCCRYEGLFARVQALEQTSFSNQAIQSELLRMLPRGPAGDAGSNPREGGRGPGSVVSSSDPRPQSPMSRDRDKGLFMRPSSPTRMQTESIAVAKRFNFEPSDVSRRASVAGSAGSGGRTGRRSPSPNRQGSQAQVSTRTQSPVRASSPTGREGNLSRAGLAGQRASSPLRGMGVTKQELQGSLADLVSKVHDALAAKNKAGAPPDPLGYVDYQSDSGAGGSEATRAKSPSRPRNVDLSTNFDVFKESLLELLQENRALQQDTHEFVDSNIRTGMRHATNAVDDNTPRQDDMRHSWQERQLQSGSSGGMLQVRREPSDNSFLQKQQHLQQQQPQPLQQPQLLPPQQVLYSQGIQPQQYASPQIFGLPQQVALHPGATPPAGHAYPHGCVIRR